MENWAQNVHSVHRCHTRTFLPQAHCKQNGICSYYAFHCYLKLSPDALHKLQTIIIFAAADQRQPREQRVCFLSLTRAQECPEAIPLVLWLHSKAEVSHHSSSSWDPGGCGLCPGTLRRVAQSHSECPKKRFSPEQWSEAKKPPHRHRNSKIYVTTLCGSLVPHS